MGDEVLPGDSIRLARKLKDRRRRRETLHTGHGGCGFRSDTRQRYSSCGFRPGDAPSEGISYLIRGEEDGPRPLASEEMIDFLSGDGDYNGRVLYDTTANYK